MRLSNVSKTLFEISRPNSSYCINLRNISLSRINRLGSFLIFDDSKSKKFIIRFPYGDYETLNVGFDHNIDFEVLQALSKMAYFYSLNDFRSALIYIDDLNTNRPDWVEYWPSYRVIIAFFSLLLRVKYHIYIINYFTLFEKNGLVISSKLFQQILISCIHVKNYDKAYEILVRYPEINVSEDFIPIILQTISKSTPLPILVSIMPLLVDKIPPNIKLREVVVDSFMNHLNKIMMSQQQKNLCTEQLLQSDDFKYIKLLFNLIQSQRYELSVNQTKLMINWFNRFFKNNVSLKVSKIYAGNWSRCHFCGYNMERISKPTPDSIFKDALLEVVKNIKSMISISNIHIKTEFQCFDIFLRKNFPIFSLIDYSNIRSDRFYIKSLNKLDPNKNSYSDTQLWEEFSHFWYPILNYCPTKFNICCVVPIFYSQELRFLSKKNNFKYFSTKYMSEDILCIYGCALTYLQLMESNFGNHAIPKIISNDEFENFYQLAPINSMIFKRWLYHTRGFLDFEDGKYRFKSHTYDRVAKMDDNSMHFPIKGHNWLCIKFIF